MNDDLFRNRAEAGKRLAERLLDYAGSGAVVLAIPRGGVPVAYEIAKRLGAELDVIIPRKMPIPWNPEAGFGAITADGTMVLNEPMVESLGLTPDDISRVAEEVRREVVRRTRAYRGEKPPVDVAGKIVILVDDGLASGYTMLAAIQSVRKLSPSKVIVAVPVASSSAARLVERAADRVIALVVSDRLPFAVADFYLEWRDLTDEEVLHYMQSNTMTQP